MALNDVKVIKGGGIVETFRVDDTTTSSDTQILPGDPVKKSNSNFVGHVATAEPVITAPMWGIATSYSTETSTTEGTVELQQVIPGKTVLRCKVTTPGNMDTDAELLAILQDTVTFDLTGTVYTVNENEGDDPNVHGILIINGDIEKGTVDFMLKAYAVEQTSST